MRILQVASSLNRISGVANVIMNYYRLLKDRVTFDFLLYDDYDNSFCEEARSYGSKIYFIPKFGLKTYFKYKKQVSDFFAEHAGEYDAVHLHELMSQKAVISAAHKSGLKVIIHSHGRYPGVKLVGLAKGLRNAFLLHGFRRNADVYLACSDHAAAAFKKETGVTVLQNGIDVDRYFVGADLRAELGILKDAFVLGSAGRITHVKNPLYIIKVFAECKKTRPDAVLVMAGSGDMAEDCKACAKELGVSDSVIFTGNRSDMPQLLNTFDCFIMPSFDFEGLPMTLVEAQGTGCPCVVSTNVPAEADIVGGGVKFLSLADSIDKWRDAVFSFAERPSHADIKASFLQKGFDLAASATTLYDIYAAASEKVVDRG